MSVPLSSGNYRRDGFTLVELLIAMTLLVLIVLILFDALNLASRAWDDNDFAEGRVSETTMTREWIRRQLTQAQPITLNAEIGRSELAFDGEPAAVTFIGSIPAHLGGGGLSWIRLRLEDSADGRQLVMDRERYQPDLEPDLEPEPGQAPRVLIEDIATARFGYFGSLTPEEPAAWHDQWTEVGYLPSLLRLELQFSPARDQPWPILIAAPMIDGSRRAEHGSLVAAATVPDA